MNYSSIVFLLTSIYSSLVFSVTVNIQSSQCSKELNFEEEPSECEILTYVKDNIKIFFPDISKLDRGLTIIRTFDSSYYVRLSNDSNCYHCNENGMYVCKNCCKNNLISTAELDYKLLPPFEYNLHCHRCKQYFISEDDHTAHLIKCVPSFFEKFLN